MLAGLVLSAITLVPSFHALANFANPALSAFSKQYPIDIKADNCNFSLFSVVLTDCDKARSFFSRNGLSFSTSSSINNGSISTHIGTDQLAGFDERKYKAALKAKGFSLSSANINYAGAVAIIVWLITLVGMVYGPMGAFMVEMFPARIRTTSLSVPYHAGVGILGGFLPFIASALVIYRGNIFAGLWYPVGVVFATAIVGAIFLPETRDRALND